jgi:hypothetical protein
VHLGFTSSFKVSKHYTLTLVSCMHTRIHDERILDCGPMHAYTSKYMNRPQHILVVVHAQMNTRRDILFFIHAHMNTQSAYPISERRAHMVLHNMCTRRRNTCILFSIHAQHIQHMNTQRARPVFHTHSLSNMQSLRLLAALDLVTTGLQGSRSFTHCVFFIHAHMNA